MTPVWLGLDIGGANLKAAQDGGPARVCPFPLWKRPEELPGVLAELIAAFPAAERLAVTMTAEPLRLLRDEGRGRAGDPGGGHARLAGGRCLGVGHGRAVCLGGGDPALSAPRGGGELAGAGARGGAARARGVRAVDRHRHDDHGRDPLARRPPRAARPDGHPASAHRRAGLRGRGPDADLCAGHRAGLAGRGRRNDTGKSGLGRRVPRVPSVRV